jgi:hypothetical protein
LTWTELASSLGDPWTDELGAGSWESGKLATYYSVRVKIRSVFVCYSCTCFARNNIFPHFGNLVTIVPQTKQSEDCLASRTHDVEREHPFVIAALASQETIFFPLLGIL